MSDCLREGGSVFSVNNFDVYFSKQESCILEPFEKHSVAFGHVFDRKLVQGIQYRGRHLTILLHELSLALYGMFGAVPEFENHQMQRFLTP